MPYYQTGKRRNYFIEFGSGPPVVLLHGITNSGRAWGPQIAPLVSAGFRVIVPDLAGHGASAHVERPFGIDDMVDDLAALWTHLGIGNADLVGLSLGGMVTLQLALERPELAGRLIVANTPDSTASPESRKNLGDLAALCRSEDGPVTVLEQSWPMMVNEGFRNSGAGLRTFQVWHGVAATAHGPSLAYVAEGLAGFDFQDSIASLKRPVLFISGEKDATAPPEAVGRMAHKVPEAGYIELAGALHISNADSEEQFNKSLLAFLQGRRSPSP